MPDSPPNVPIIEVAKESFAKNLVNSEQFNLYNGLFNLAIVVQQIHEEILEMKDHKAW
jgi:hypothetical protein